MKKIKHSKYKNTGILFELLVRQITSDTLNNVSESKAGTLIRKYFNKNKPLSKELALYQTIIKEKFNTENKANSLVEACITAKAKLNNTTLTREKYNLIKEIRDTWNIDDFFSSRVSNYKVLASIYTIFEYKVEDNPKTLVESKYTLLEHITFNKTSKEDKGVLSEDFSAENKDIRHLAYKLMLEKFNSKYQNFGAKQKTLLKTYITNVSNTTTMKEFVAKECITLTKELKSLNTKVSDQVTKIKINESIKLLKELTKGKVVKDEEVLSLMKYYELTNEIKKAIL
jgi:hypothetical protein